MQLTTLARQLRAIALPAALAVAATSAFAQAGKPQYGGQLNIGNVYVTVSPLSPDNADWPWKHNQDTGLVYEQLFAADLTKARRNGGKYPFISDAWLPTDSLRGELAESWKMEQNPLRVVVKLRRGVMFPAKPGVMEARELTAEDVVFSYERLNKSPKKIPGYFDHLTKVEANDKHTVTFHFKEYNAEWDYRFGWGYYSAIIPKEVAAAGATQWKNLNGTGPYTLGEYVQSASLSFNKNPNYWDKEKIGGQEYKLPFADKITYRYIKDEATFLTALRTAKLDILEAVRWSAVEELKKSAPQIQWSRYLANGGSFIALRMDTKPFDDVRVRRALNMAVDKQAIIKQYYGGNAEMFTYPMHPNYTGYYEPLETMPPEVKELYTFNPAKAKQLLAEAGHPKGFSFKVQTSSSSVEADLLAMIAAYLQKVGVTMEIETLDYGAYLSAMTTKKNAPGYFMFLGHTNPTTALRKSFVKGQMWNPSQFYDADIEKKMAEVLAEPDERVRQVKVRLMTRQILAQAPSILLPTPYVYTGWWPWVKNYGGELRAGAERPGPIHARIWVDQELKKKLGK
ncbi:ABC transporter substrate-binding protein [Rhizobacter sp. J219]|jgi:peptide/nickel transport system substrate-binding protein|uniref:ABC transporter substrate-binding protein n=1 Tax=Rhizobacter sp. J219 TaxID=2898430 RepID=UPI002150BA8B|nr:ABC transporter substrate-binding protein [Rhizobacter sp. J219]MCR5883881.1 ABC transporter substrate-binding protein [Rhizobacter sp. J219]